jgi:uroporphyrinogen decarboxylase
MNARECILAALDRRPPERLPMWETSFWPETLARWQTEGLPVGVEPVDYFGLDRCCCINDLFDPSFVLTPRTLEQTAEYRIYVDRYGKTIKEWLHATATPSILEPAVRTAADWERLKPTLTPAPAKFNNPPAEADHRAAQAGGHFTAITPAEPVWFVLELTMGFELGLAAMLRQRELVADMLRTYTDYVLAMLDLTLARGYRFDALWFWSDLCYRNGLLFSPRLARELALPHWQRLGRYAHEHGMRFMFHCDGNVSQLIPLLLEAGLDGIHPLEARAGNDVRVYKRAFGDRLCLIGNINADVVATNDRDQIEREVAAKVPAAAAGGGYIYHIDHSVPPTISLDAYRYLLDCVRRHGSRPAAPAQAP